MPIFLFLTLALSAWADQPPHEAMFRSVCRNHRQGAQDFIVEAPEVGVETFFPLLALEATQTRFSFSRFNSSMAKALRQEPHGLSHDHGRSLYGLNKKLRAVFYRGKLYIIDGHHRALISTYLGAQTAPVQIVDDLSHLDFEQFRQVMTLRGWADWRDWKNRPMEPIDLCEMENDPNFMLARLIIRRVSVEIAEGAFKIQRSSGAKVAVAIKINGDIPFFENHIADALRDGGIEFQDDLEEDEFNKKELEQFLDILKSKAQNHLSPLNKVLLLDKPRPVAKLPLEQVVLKHLRQHTSCERGLLL